MTDMIFCESVSHVLFGGLFLHPLWHLGSGVGSWCAIYATIAARDQLKVANGDKKTKKPQFKWLFGCLPCVDHGLLLLDQKKKM